jgi:hypothetical protein
MTATYSQLMTDCLFSGATDQFCRPLGWLNCFWPSPARYSWRQSHRSHSCLTTGGLPPISSSWGQAPWGPRSEIYLQLNPCRHSPYVTSSLTRGWVCLLWMGFAFVKCMYRTYSMLLKILPFALYTSPLSVQALQIRSCLSYLSYATTAA